MQKFKAGDKVLFFRDVSNEPCDRDKYLGGIITLGDETTIGIPLEGSKVHYFIQECYGYIVRDVEIRGLTKLDKALL